MIDKELRRCVVASADGHAIGACVTVTLNADRSPSVSSLPDETRRRIEELLHPLCLKVYALVTEQAFSRPNVETVARALSCSSRQLERRFVDEGLPPPHRLVVLARWIPVSRSLANKTAATRSVARALGFASTQAFCHAARRELRMSIGELRRFEAPFRIAHDLMTAYQVPLECRELATLCRKSDTAMGVAGDYVGSR